jgi:hypothetical protein
MFTHDSIDEMTIEPDGSLFPADTTCRTHQQDLQWRGKTLTAKSLENFCNRIGNNLLAVETHGNGII